MIMATTVNEEECGCITTRGCTGELHTSRCDIHGGTNTNLYQLKCMKINKILEDAQKKKRKTIPVKKLWIAMNYP